MSSRYLYFLILAFLSISMLAQRQQPFEGIITYVVKTELKQDSHLVNKYYAQKYGDTLKIYYARNGSERREYHNTGSYGLEYSIYNKINNEEYTKWHGLDYVVYSSSADTLTRLDSLTRGDASVILGDTCKSLVTKATDLKSNEVTHQTLYFREKEHIMPHAYAKRKAGHYDKLYGESKSLFLRWDLDMQYANITFTAISVERTNVDANLFIIPNGITKMKKKI